jgi:hypothetical protein
VYSASFDSGAGEMHLFAGFDQRAGAWPPSKAKGEAFQLLLTPFEKVEHLIKLTCEQAS